MKEKIAVLGANEPLIPFYRQAKALGYEIIGIATENGAVCKQYCDKFYPVSFADKDKVVEICNNEKVSVNGKIVKAHYEVQIGDEISIKFGDRLITHTVENIPYESKKKKGH